MITAADAGAPDDPAPLWACDGDMLLEVAEIVGLPARRIALDAPTSASGGAPAHVRYIEDKRIDWQRVRETTALSEHARHWANFGPVSLALERVLAQILRLPPDRAVIMCASATVGLQVLAGLEAVRRGRKLRWVVCAYTFFSQRTGSFAEATVVDCDDRGMMDLDAVAALPDDAWDGLVVTNLFAGLPGVQPFADFCAARGKALILDSAAAMCGPDRRSPGFPNEAISFHQTKPWGVGEGGCVIVNRADEGLARSAINLGIGGPPLLKSFAGNGKISDVACALILERLERLPGWARSYHAQRTRIEQLCGAAGVPLLVQAPRDAILASVPVLSAHPIERGDFAGCAFDVGKYYPPLDGTGCRARHIFAHVINLPSHSGMAAIDRPALTSALRRLAPRHDPAASGGVA